MLVAAGLLVVALVAWSFAGQPGMSTFATAALFLAACGALLLALRRRPWGAVAIIGVLALPMNPTALDVLDVWSVLFMSCTSLGLVMGLRKHEGLRWAAGSIPFWAMSTTAAWAQYVALGLVFLGFALGAVGPTLPGRRRRANVTPLPHLASGPLVAVAPREYPNGQPSRVIRAAIVVFGVLAGALALLSIAGWNAAASGGLAIAAAIIAATFAFSNWFAGRVRLRVDEAGLHSRLFYREHTIAWNEIAFLSLRYVFLPGVGGRIVYYCVRSREREIAFPSSMRSAVELQRTVEAATGLAWPVPEITPTL